MKKRELDWFDVFFADYSLKGGEISIILPSENAVTEFLGYLRGKSDGTKNSITSKNNRKMKKLAVLGMGVCVALAFSSCKSSESAYKKAYEKAKQQELAEPQQTEPVQEVAAPVEVKVVESAPVGVRQEKVTVVSGGELKRFSVVCGAFGVKANAEGVKNTLVNENYAAMVVYNAERNLYRVVIGTFDDRASAENLRDSFKASHPSNADYQKAWLLYSAD